MTGTRFPQQPGTPVPGSARTEDTVDGTAAQERLQLAASIFSHAHEGIMITTLDAEIVDVNAAFTEITGYDRHEVLGKTPRLLGSGKHDSAFYADMWRQLTAAGHWRGEIWNRRKSGEMVVQTLTISAVCDSRGQPLRYVGLLSAASPQRERDFGPERVAHYDALTGLPNRVLLADRLRQAMLNARRRHEKLALVFVDLDGFKTINDTHGHAAGDKLLVALAGRMAHGLRGGDTLARLGGDEFVALLLDLSEDDAAMPVVERMRAAAAQPTSVDGDELRVSASLGVTFYPQDHDVDAEQLLRQADRAMYRAKAAGKDRICVFSEEQDHDVRGHRDTLEALRQAIANREFELHYQPKVNMRTGQKVGVEALIRWRHRDQGLLRPAAFMPALTDHALGVELGEWVLAEALSQIQAWKACGLQIPVSVNIGAWQIQRPDFVARLQGLLAGHAGVAAGDLELEVLETSSLEDIARVSMVMEACRALGVGFVLDDFGTGYSSLTYLRRLPTSLLKIDRRVVHDMLDDPEDLTILQGVIGLAAAFGKEVMAEGVETLAHGRVLLYLGCECAQGYAIARPMPAQAIPHWWATWQPDPGWLNLAVLSRERVPAIFAAVEHRAWIAEVLAHLQGDRDAPPPLDPHHCRFGHWLDQQLAAGYPADQGVLEALERLHRDIHDRAQALVAMKRRGSTREVRSGSSEILALRDRLLAELLKVL